MILGSGKQNYNTIAKKAAFPLSLKKCKEDVEQLDVHNVEISHTHTHRDSQVYMVNHWII